MFRGNFDVVGSDRVHCCLPLYHSSGLLIGFGFTVATGATFILSPKFSASKFWEEVISTKATVVMYIGELCRYLLNAYPDHESAKSIRSSSSVRIAIGNGLRPDIWMSFRNRFGVPQIGEFYASTEGNTALFNHNYGEHGAGAIGQIGPILEKFYKLKIAVVDAITETPARGKDGFCIETKPGVPGELLAPIIPGDPSRQFVGYTDNKAGTEKKVIKNAFVKGDAYFRTGDLLKKDSNGFYYFIDRLGGNTLLM